MPPPPIVDLSHIDFGRVVADLEQIRQVNPQRNEMEQLTAVVWVDSVQHMAVGYKDVRLDEFWVQGHMPGYPLMPGVLICEAAAQLCSYYTITYKLIECDFMGFGGLENVRFRGVVRPGDRLILMGKATKIHRRVVICTCQAFVGTTMVFQGDVHGVPMMRGQPAPAEPES
jgi:3-hydroxyacyl-[acyl-carrier-protein] dehydratase